MIDVPKELCEVYERKEIGQPVTLTGKRIYLQFYFINFSKSKPVHISHWKPIILHVIMQQKCVVFKLMVNQ